MKDVFAFTKRLLSVYEPFKRPAKIVFVFIVLQQLLALPNPYIFGWTIDALSRRQFELILPLALASLAVSLLQTGVCYFWDRYENINIHYVVSEYVKEQTLGKISAFSIGQHNSQNSGLKTNIIMKGQEALKQMAFNLIYQMGPMCLEVVLIIAALLILNWQLGLIVLAAALLLTVLTIRKNIQAQPKLIEIENRFNADGSRYYEILRNMDLIKLNSQEERVTREYGRQFRQANLFCRNFWLEFIVFLHGRGIIFAVTTFLVILAGSYFVKAGEYSLGHMVVFLSWSGNALAKLYSLADLQRNLVSQYAQVRQFFSFLDTEPDVKVAEHPVRPERFCGSIEFNDVSFTYPSRDSAAAEVSRKAAVAQTSFTVNPGERVAFVGESGAGKSTIVNLLVRAYDPCSGHIRIDGIDLKELDPVYYREHLGVVEQNVVLWDDTLANNIRFGCNGNRASITGERLDAIARDCCIDRFYDKLEKGFDTVIGERGVKLSGGERQRVGIARALAKEPSIMIFDEATSHLDAHNEEMIRDAIDRASVGRTTIIIAHRLSTVKSADRIFVLDGGRLVAAGKHADLAESCPQYQKLVSSQVSMIC